MIEGMDTTATEIGAWDLSNFFFGCQENNWLKSVEGCFLIFQVWIQLLLLDLPERNKDVTI